MAPKKKVAPKTAVKKTEMTEDTQSPRAKMASERALSQYVNSLVKKVQGQYPNRKLDQFADAANQIIETSEGNKKEDIRLINRAANKLGIEDSRYGIKFGGDVPVRKNKPGTTGKSQGKKPKSMKA
jgi:hypothetical protein